jgi:hypothetical protein
MASLLRRIPFIFGTLGINYRSYFFHSVFTIDYSPDTSPDNHRFAKTKNKFCLRFLFGQYLLLALLPVKPDFLLSTQLKFPCPTLSFGGPYHHSSKHFQSLQSNLSYCGRKSVFVAGGNKINKSVMI